MKSSARNKWATNINLCSSTWVSGCSECKSGYYCRDKCKNVLDYGHVQIVETEMSPVGSVRCPGQMERWGLLPVHGAHLSSVNNTAEDTNLLPLGRVKGKGTTL